MATMQFERSLALVGIGYWGKNLARNFHTLGVLHTICDTSPDLLKLNQEKYPDVAFTSNFGSLLTNPEITTLAIAAPAPLHYQLTRQALLAGKDVFVEKPLCLTVVESEELVRIAAERSRILMVGHILHYHPCVQRLQEMVRAGELGKIQYITSNRLNLGSIRTEENALWNFAPHDVSVILSLVGERMPDEVRCVGSECVSPGVADVSLTTLRFKGDLRAHIYVSWLNPFKEQRLVIVGSRGLVVFDDTKPWKEKLLIYRNHVHWPEGRAPMINPNEMEHIEVVEKEPLREECLHFLECCRDRKTPRTDGKEGLRVMRILEAAQESMDDHGDVKYPAQPHTVDDTNTFVHPTAFVDAGAIIGEGSKVWHFSHIMKGAEIGPHCNLGQNVVVSPHSSSR
jgi:UDP-2-acetamido-3-amino-2,3-dideoxy-glucuronate N-acetyltransferase